jgi:hypothetical protein
MFAMAEFRDQDRAWPQAQIGGGRQNVHGLSFNTNYTWSHAIDNATNEFLTSFLNPRRAPGTNQLGDDRSNSDLDIRQKFALAKNRRRQ